MNLDFDPPCPASLRILVVDDEPSIREVLGLFFLEEGHEVTTASDGDEALAMFRSGSWDVVFTDRLMPRMSGDALARAIRKIDPTMPIVLVTGYADLMPSPAPGKPLFKMVVRKPFTRETLRAALASVHQDVVAGSPSASRACVTSASSSA